MSLAYKLWKIGTVLDRNDMKKVIKLNPDTLLKSGEEPRYINLDFNINGKDNPTLTIGQSAISKEKMFFTKKLGGSGPGIYYLYPNIVLHLNKMQSIASKLFLLVKTMNQCVLKFSSEENKPLSQAIVNFFKEKKEYPLLDFLDEFKNGVFWVWISINGSTIPDLMPEIWENWFNTPALELKDAALGYDSFSGRETMVGFRPEFKIFSYDQYHNSLHYRIRKNIPLSLESAGKIKLAWIYILEKLVFHYKGLEYLIIPNLMIDAPQTLREIIARLITANAMTKGKYNKLQALRKEEKKILKSLEKLQKPAKNKKPIKTDQNEKIQILENIHKETTSSIDSLDTGFITEFKEQADHLTDLKNAVTLDFIFTIIDKKTLSFEVPGSIEDVMPSRLTQIVDTMRSEGMDENITLKSKKKDKVYLQDYFNRDELYFVLNKTHQQNSNRILQERLFLTRLLLTDVSISLENLMARFELNREYDYSHKKRVHDGIKDWINRPGTYTMQESKTISFFKKLNKIKE